MFSAFIFGTKPKTCETIDPSYRVNYKHFRPNDEKSTNLSTTYTGYTTNPDEVRIGYKWFTKDLKYSDYSDYIYELNVEYNKRKQSNADYYAFKTIVDAHHGLRRNTKGYRLYELSVCYNDPSMFNKLEIMVNKFTINKKISKRLNGIYINTAGDEYHYKNNELHRDDDLPAVILKDGTKKWYINGKLTRNNKQAPILWYDGTIGWQD